MKMLNSDPNNPMMKMLQQQFPNVNPKTLSRVMSALSYLMIAYAKIRQIWSYTITKIIIFLNLCLLCCLADKINLI